MVAVTAVFLGGLDRRFARNMDPIATTLPQRLATLEIVGMLSVARLVGPGRWAVPAAVLPGLPVVTMNLWELQHGTNASRAA